jgi:hypothetical protein
MFYKFQEDNSKALIPSTCLFRFTRHLPIRPTPLSTSDSAPAVNPTKHAVSILPNASLPGLP